MRAANRFFTDTNILLYALDPADPVKRAQARLWLDALWRFGSGSLSWQVLHEFYVNGHRKLKWPEPELRKTVELFATWRPIENSVGLIQRAWFWMDDSQTSFWDSLILAAAERAGCPFLLSEDFQAGRRYGPITIVSPFLSVPGDFGL
jgi:predicted nucleic acid-binding protein